MRKLEFFWDVGSPYTYLATTQLEGLRKRTGAVVEFRPFLLGGVFKSAGNQLPAAVPNKAVYMLKDLTRWGAHYGVPLKVDAPFPLVTLLPMRVAIAADLRGKGEPYCHAIFRAYWADGRDVSAPDEVGRVLQTIGLDPKELLEAANTQEVKDKLRANTDEAVARGAFGAPAMFVGEELYWGNDRLEFVERALKNA
jgi:2-hydroxychromene-2-carboxylate isomerase